MRRERNGKICIQGGLTSLMSDFLSLSVLCIDIQVSFDVIMSKSVCTTKIKGYDIHA